jgi:hypothetical protein
LVSFYSALAHSANPDVLAVSESWLRKATISILRFPYPATTFSIMIELPKGEELQSTAEIACNVLSYFPGLYTNSLNFLFEPLHK